MQIVIHDIELEPENAVHLSEIDIKTMYNSEMMDIGKIAQETVRELIEYFASVHEANIVVVDYTGDLKGLEAYIDEIAETYKIEIEIL